MLAVPQVTFAAKAFVAYASTFAYHYERALRAKMEPCPREPVVGAFGDKLRKQREQRGIALDAISNTTKISPRMLRALEEEHFDQLPGGVFNKGFVRAYARQIGLDEEETVTEYLTALRESQVRSQQILPDFRVPGGKPSVLAAPNRNSETAAASDSSRAGGKNNGGHAKGSTERRKQDDRRNEVRRRDRDRDGSQADITRTEDHPGKEPVEQRSHPSSASGFITYAAAERSTDPAEPPARGLSQFKPSPVQMTVVLLLLIVGFAVWASRRHRDSSSEAAAPANPSPSSAQVSPATAASAGTPAPPSSSSLKANSSKGTPLPPASAIPSVDKSSTAINEPSTTHTAPASAAAGTVVAKSTTRLPATQPPVATFTLLIRADKTTWISVTADGKPAAQETLIAPAHTSIRATREIVVKTGNAAGVSFLLNGKEISPPGNEGEVKTYIFDSTGLKPAL